MGFKRPEVQIFSPRPKRRGLNSSATLSLENSFESIAHSFRRSALFRCAEMRAVHSLLVSPLHSETIALSLISARGGSRLDFKQQMCCAPCFVGGEKRMTTRDAHVRSLNFSPARSATDASLRSVCLPAFLLTPTPFSRPFAIPSLRSLQIFSPRPKRRGLNSSATLSSENSFESIAHSFRRSALFRCAEMRAVHSLLVSPLHSKLSRCVVIFSRGTACEHDKTAP